MDPSSFEIASAGILPRRVVASRRDSSGADLRLEAFECP
jgi:hypothetical protein